MKKIVIFLVTFLALFTFVGCDGYDEYSDRGYYDDENRLYLVDQDGFAVSNIRYTCDDGRAFERTSRDGAFFFFDNEDCELELDIRDVDSRVDSLFIEDNLGEGIEGVKYFCDNGDEGRTDRNGHFYFDNEERNDVCTLLL